MKARYVGPNIGVDGLVNNNVYEVLGVDELSGALRIVDESGDDYLYSPVRPKSASGEYRGGRIEIVEDDKDETLAKAIRF